MRRRYQAATTTILLDNQLAHPGNSTRCCSLSILIRAIGLKNSLQVANTPLRLTRAVVLLTRVSTRLSTTELRAAIVVARSSLASDKIPDKEFSLSLLLLHTFIFICICRPRCLAPNSLHSWVYWPDQMGPLSTPFCKTHRAK